MTDQGPLANIRVLDIASFMAAPMAAMWLGDFGADVVKVEHPDIREGPLIGHCVISLWSAG